LSFACKNRLIKEHLAPLKRRSTDLGETPMKRILSSLIISSAALLFAAPTFAETFTVTFVQTNDIDRMDAGDDRGGFAKLAAVVNAERAKGGNVFFVHSGDTISPSLLSGIDKGAHVIDILNQMKLDVMVPGNHEFDFGPDIFVERMKQATFPVVSSNVVMPEGGGPPNSAVNRIVEVNGVNIGFYGLTTEDTVEVSSPGDIVFTDSVDTGVDAAEDLRTAGADIVVAVVHTPIDVDFALARADAADVILSGHDEHLLAYYDGRRVLTESGSQADWVVITDLTVNREEADGKVTIAWHPEFRLVDTVSVEPDPAIAEVVASYNAKLDAALGEVVGKTETALDSRRATVRSQEAAIGNLIADAIRSTVGADVAITNGGGIRGDREYSAGIDLTGKDVFSELPFGNKTVKLEVTGEQIVAALENGFSQVETGAGRFPQVSGLTVTADVSEPPGSRVVDVRVGGAPVDPAKTYTLATNDFMARGGDGYTPFAGATNLINAVDATLMASQVMDYIKAAGTISPKVEGRIVIKQ
jgi:2',3'-cyclic-nucleotide 2'-phosphodiesterase (5'-nucleotidase family)